MSLQSKIWSVFYLYIFSRIFAIIYINSVIKVGDMVFKTKIKCLINEEVNMVNLLQSEDSIVIMIVRGKNQLKFESMSNYFNSCKSGSKYFVDLLFSYKENLLYTVTDENYWCPTCERIIRKHYNFSSTNEIKKIMSSYRETMNSENKCLKELIDVNYPILSLLPSGKYIISLRYIFPTFGEKEIFSKFSDRILTSSSDTYYSLLDSCDEIISVDSSTSFMLPTQTSESYSETTINQYREKEYLGRGLVINLSGFLGCLLDGHHKATVAYERNQALECFVIEPYKENNVYKAFNCKSNVLNINNIPTIDEFCYVQSFIEENDITSIEDLKELIKKMLLNKEWIEDMEQLVVTLYLFKPEVLIDLYNIILENYWYKDIRFRYFYYLLTLERTETIEQLILDFLINDDYENKQLTRLCEDYFR